METSGLMWLAGYLEGEGCFRISGVGQIKRRPNSAGTPSVKVAATDEDVVARAAALMGCVSRKSSRATVSGTTVFYAEVHGDKALRLMRMLLPHMGVRRSQKIRDVLAVAAARLNRAARGLEKPNAKLSDDDVRSVRDLATSGIRQVEIAQRFRISQAAISLVLTGRTYRHVI